MPILNNPPNLRRLPWLLSVLASTALVGISTVDPASAWAASGPLSQTNYLSVPAGADSYKYWGEQVREPGRVEYVSDPAGKRGIVQRVEVQPGDVIGHGERAEVLNTHDLGGFKDGQTLVMSWGLMIDSTFESPPSDWNSFVQIHADGGGNQPPVSLNLAGDQADLVLGLVGGGDWISEAQPRDAVSETFNLGRLPKNQWHDFVLELRFGCTGTGYVRIWLDGQEIVDAHDLKIGYCGDPGLYWKQGFYRSAYDKPTRLWFSDTFHWANTADVCGYYRCGKAPPDP